mgnify:FL=1
MNLILNKNSIILNNIKFIHKFKYTKLIYDLNNVFMNGIFIRINEFKIYKNNEFIYLILLNKQDINIINEIILYINDHLKINIPSKNNIIKLRNNNNLNDDHVDLNINNIKKFDNNFVLYIYN